MIGTFLQIVEYVTADSDCAVHALSDFLSQFHGYSVWLLEKCELDTRVHTRHASSLSLSLCVSICSSV